MFWKTWRDSQSPQPAHALSLNEIRDLILAVVADCECEAAERIRGHAHLMRSAADLWHLRQSVFEVVARRHCESEAARRVNGLVPAFEGWMPQSALVRV
jgi:hypothetical protein